MALLSNPKSQSSLAQLPKIRAFCADHPDVFHYEVEDAGQVGEAMRSIARVRPCVLAINGCEGTVHAACVELGNSAAGPATGNTLILKCVNETDVALSQAGGSGLELWGDTGQLGLSIPYIQVDNAQGRGIDGSDAYQSLAAVAVAYGVASNTNLNRALNEPSPSLPWNQVASS